MPLTPWFRFGCRHDFRYQAVLLRDRFDQTANITDMHKAKKLLLDGEAELWEKSHFQRIRFAHAPGGPAYDRKRYIPDWVSICVATHIHPSLRTNLNWEVLWFKVLDTWHPYEKAAFPDYFARREMRKKEFIERWEKEYGEKIATDH